jgi:hemerythrin
MALTEWDKSLSVNIKLMDIQHENLLNITIDITQRIQQNQQEKALTQFENLLNYLQFHFAEEEKLLEKEKYNDFYHHKSQHLILISDIHRRFEIIENGNDELFLLYIEIIHELLVSHSQIEFKNKNFKEVIIVGGGAGGARSI